MNEDSGSGKEIGGVGGSDPLSQHSEDEDMPQMVTDAACLLGLSLLADATASAQESMYSAGAASFEDAGGKYPGSSKGQFVGTKRRHIVQEDIEDEEADERDGQGSKSLGGATMKVYFDDGGVRLADGRIYVPLSFIQKNFTYAQVKIARSQNKSRKHGLGNHWITGHQRLIRHYKDVRLVGLEIAGQDRIKLDLSASGVWDPATVELAKPNIGLAGFDLGSPLPPLGLPPTLGLSSLPLTAQLGLPPMGLPASLSSLMPGAPVMGQLPISPAMPLLPEALLGRSPLALPRPLLPTASEPHCAASAKSTSDVAAEQPSAVISAPPPSEPTKRTPVGEEATADAPPTDSGEKVKAAGSKTSVGGSIEGASGNDSAAPSDARRSPEVVPGVVPGAPRTLYRPSASIPTASTVLVLGTPKLIPSATTSAAAQEQGKPQTEPALLQAKPDGAPLTLDPPHSSNQLPTNFQPTSSQFPASLLQAAHSHSSSQELRRQATASPPVASRQPNSREELEREVQEQHHMQLLLLAQQQQQQQQILFKHQQQILAAAASAAGIHTSGVQSTSLGLPHPYDMSLLGGANGYLAPGGTQPSISPSLLAAAASAATSCSSMPLSLGPQNGLQSSLLDPLASFQGTAAWSLPRSNPLQPSISASLLAAVSVAGSPALTHPLTTSDPMDMRPPEGSPLAGPEGLAKGWQVPTSFFSPFPGPDPMQLQAMHGLGMGSMLGTGPGHYLGHQSLDPTMALGPLHQHGQLPVGLGSPYQALHQSLLAHGALSMMPGHVDSLSALTLMQQQQQHQQLQSMGLLPPSLPLPGAPGLRGHLAQAGMRAGSSGNKEGAPQQFPRLYDGRIHVPLSLIQSHLSAADFPVAITARVFVNNSCIGDAITARIVKYKKHKAGVTWEYGTHLTVMLLAA
eukprot:gene19431-26089_t